MQAKRYSGMQGMAVDGTQEARAHVMGAKTWGMAADGAQEVRAHVKMGRATQKGARPHKRGPGHMKGGWATQKGAGPCERRPGYAKGCWEAGCVVRRGRDASGQPRWPGKDGQDAGVGPVTCGG